MTCVEERGFLPRLDAIDHRLVDIDVDLHRRAKLDDVQQDLARQNGRALPDGKIGSQLLIIHVSITPWRGAQILHAAIWFSSFACSVSQGCLLASSLERAFTTSVLSSLMVFHLV